MKINVTQEDIKNGIPGDPYCCPVARACARALNNKTVSTTGLSINYWPTPYDFKSLHTPSTVTAFVYSFDNGEDPGPFEFELNV